MLGVSNCQTFALGRGVTRSSIGNEWLLLKYQRRSAYSLPFEVDCHLDPISDFDERNAAVHAIVLAVEGHRPFDLARTSPLAGKRKRQLLGFGHSAYCEVADVIKRVWAGLYNLRRVKRDQRIVLGVEKVFCPSISRLSYRFRYSHWLLES